MKNRRSLALLLALTLLLCGCSAAGVQRTEGDYRFFWCCRGEDRGGIHFILGALLLEKVG